MNRATVIPVARPRLPRLAAITPYIERIDAARWYSNFGPLCTEFEARLAERFGLPQTGVTTIANATMGLSLALKTAGAKAGSLCVMPSWTFSASVHAAIDADLVPFFVDVDKDGVLTPAIAREALAQAPSMVGAVMPISVWGQPLDPAQWDQFAEESGIAVVLDAAPAFDSARPGRVLSAVSLHATKSLGIGEGGFVMCSCPDLVAEVRRRSNFGFEGSREAQIVATNGKLSEYTAAVGLAALDEWPDRRAAFQNAAMRYRENLADLPDVRLPNGWGRDWQSTTCIVRLRRSVAPLSAALHDAGIETRSWWGHGMHLHRAFTAFPRLSLATTRRLADTTLGLPFYIDMKTEEIDRVCAVLREELTRCS